MKDPVEDPDAGALTVDRAAVECCIDRFFFITEGTCGGFVVDNDIGRECGRLYDI